MYQQLQAYLTQLEVLLRQHQLWQEQPIDAQALNSTMPFCHDTMAFEQWLQFVFMEKMDALVTHKLPLPSNFAIAPMAELMFANKEGGAHVIKLLQELDSVFGQSDE